MNTWTDSLASVCTLVAIITLIETRERWRQANAEINLGAFTCRVKAWQRMRRAYLLTLRHDRQEESFWRKKVHVMSEKIRGAMAVSAHGFGDSDDAVAAYRRPYKQHHQHHPDLREVERFMGSEDELEYLRRSAGQSVAEDIDDDSHLVPNPPKSGTRAQQAVSSVTPIRRRKVG